MATITQINVGGTTYDLDYDAVFAWDFYGEKHPEKAQENKVNILKGDYQSVYNKMSAGLPVRMAVVWCYGTATYMARCYNIMLIDAPNEKYIDIDWTTNYIAYGTASLRTATINYDGFYTGRLRWTSSGVTLTMHNSN